MDDQESVREELTLKIPEFVAIKDNNFFNYRTERTFQLSDN